MSEGSSSGFSISLRLFGSGPGSSSALKISSDRIDVHSSAERKFDFLIDFTQDSYLSMHVENSSTLLFLSNVIDTISTLL